MAYRAMSMDAIEAGYGALTEIPPLRSGELDMVAINLHLAANSLWTLVEGRAVPTVTSGYHLVNRLGYYRSAKPVEAGVIIDELPDSALGTCDDCGALWDLDCFDSCQNCGGSTFIGPWD